MDAQVNFKMPTDILDKMKVISSKELKNLKSLTQELYEEKIKSYEKKNGVIPAEQIKLVQKK